MKIVGNTWIPGKMDERFHKDFEHLSADLIRHNESRKGELNVDHRIYTGEWVRGDGYDCPKCLNRGFRYEVCYDDQYGCSPTIVDCECSARRKVLKRLQKYGVIKDPNEYSFDKFITTQPWQKRMLDTAKRYSKDGIESGAWLYIGGQPGCGKTMLANAVCMSAMQKRDVEYVTWTQTAQELKSLVTDAVRYQEKIVTLQQAPVLYIDDFCRSSIDKTGADNGPSAADLRLAFDILNVRYIHDLPTILSSEWHLNELIKMDEAVGTRIYEKARNYTLNIKRDPNRNFRQGRMELV